MCLFLATNIQNCPHVAKNNFITQCLIHKKSSLKAVLNIMPYDERRHRTRRPPQHPVMDVRHVVLICKEGQIHRVSRVDFGKTAHSTE